MKVGPRADQELRRRVADGDTSASNGQREADPVELNSGELLLVAGRTEMGGLGTTGTRRGREEQQGGTVEIGRPGTAGKGSARRRGGGPRGRDEGSRRERWRRSEEEQRGSGVRRGSSSPWLVAASRERAREMGSGAGESAAVEGNEGR